jgi:cation diffusion facilitator CzcD-associated flavoprotein CzcO
MQDPADVTPDQIAVEVLVVGAGFSGVGAAIRLRQAGYEDLLVLEKAADLGGTWRDNMYPGCAVDVPSSLYSYSFAPNPDWSRVFAKQPEIHDYLRATAERFGVTSRIRFNTEVQKAEWDAGACRWRVRTSRGMFTTRFLVVSCGPWHQPLVPQISGLNDFPGLVMHTARWDQRVALAGKRVAVVGTGASAIQVIPEIAPDVAELHVFQRTPPWVLPRPDVAVPVAVRRVLRRLPWVQRAMRSLQYSGQESLGRGLRQPRLLGPVQALARLNLRLSVKDPSLRAALTPGYRIGCKRILTSSTYYKTLTRPNVRLHGCAVRTIDGQRVIGTDGTATEVDVIILATGFELAGFPVGEWLHDGHGRTLRELWAGTPRAYLGSTVSGLPNLFLLIGPNLMTGHSSTLYVLEQQLGYLTNALAAARDKNWSTVEVRPAVQDSYNRGLQDALASTVYNAGGCVSGYLTATGHNSFCWPWSTARLIRDMRFDAADYLITSDADVAQPRFPDPREGINVH